MKNREYMLLGAMLGNRSLVERLDPNDFHCDEIRVLVSEMQRVLDDETAPNMLNSFLDTAAPGTTGNAIDRLMMAQKLQGFRRRVNEIGIQLTNGCQLLTIPQLRDLVDELQQISLPTEQSSV